MGIGALQAALRADEPYVSTSTLLAWCRRLAIAEQQTDKRSHVRDAACAEIHRRLTTLPSADGTEPYELQLWDALEYIGGWWPQTDGSWPVSVGAVA